MERHNHHETPLAHKSVFTLKEEDRKTRGERRASDGWGQRGRAKDQRNRSQKMESWLRSNIYPGKRKQWEMIWRREEEKLSFSIISRFFHPHLLLSLDNSANFSSFHFLPARSLFVSEPLQSCLFSPRTYLICIHLLPDQTCHTTTNYLIWAVPLHRSILFPSITVPWFLAVFISFPFFFFFCTACSASPVSDWFDDIFMPLRTNSALVSLFSAEALQ